MEKGSLNIVADPSLLEVAKTKNDSRSTRFALSINVSSSSPEYAMRLNALKKLKVMLPLFKFYMDELAALNLDAEQLVLDHKAVNASILSKIK